MSEIGIITLTGASGRHYEFGVYSLDANFKAVGAVYVITERVEESDGKATHERIYIGETGDLSERFDNHHKADCFRQHKANCVCVHLDSNESSRLDKENDLLNAYSPPCND